MNEIALDRYFILLSSIEKIKVANEPKKASRKNIGTLPKKRPLILTILLATVNKYSVSVNANTTIMQSNSFIEHFFEANFINVGAAR